MGKGPSSRKNRKRGNESGVEQPYLWQYDTEKTWYDNISRLRRKQPLVGYVVTRKKMMDESIDDMMMMVSTEAQWGMNDLDGMYIGRFMKIATSVRKNIEARNEAMKKEGKGKGK